MDEDERAALARLVGEIRASGGKETNMKGSWKTTICGVSAILAAVANAVVAMTDGNPATNPEWAVVIAAVMAGVGLLKARDNDKSSESVGAK